MHVLKVYEVKNQISLTIKPCCTRRFQKSNVCDLCGIIRTGNISEFFLKKWCAFPTLKVQNIWKIIYLYRIHYFFLLPTSPIPFFSLLTLLCGHKFPGGHSLDRINALTSGSWKTVQVCVESEQRRREMFGANNKRKRKKKREIWTTDTRSTKWGKKCGRWLGICYAPSQHDLNYLMLRGRKTTVTVFNYASMTTIGPVIYLHMQLSLYHLTLSVCIHEYMCFHEHVYVCAKVFS